MNIVALGHFYTGGIKGAGQQIRTSTVCNSVEYFCPNDHIIKIDLTRSRVFSLIHFVMSIKCADVILIFPGENALPYIQRIVDKQKHKTLMIAIGGWLPNYICEANIEFFKGLSKIFVQTDEMVNRLTGKGLTNIVLFPNYRILRGKSIPIHYSSNDKAFRMVFCSRIDKRKGVFEIVEALRLMQKHNKTDFIIDFYGSGVEEDIIKVKNEIESIPQAHLCGYIDNDKMIETLNEYDVMLFPTYYEGEGFPGVIIESLIAGVPVIASRWKYNEKYVKDSVSGLLCDIKDSDGLYDSIARLYDNREFVNEMKKQCQIEALQYKEEDIVKRLIDEIERFRPNKYNR